MIITCEACNTSFNLDDKMIKPSGTKVRCSICANIFTAFPPPAPSLDTADDHMPPAAAADVGQDMPAEMPPPAPPTDIAGKPPTDDAGDTDHDMPGEEIPEAVTEHDTGGFEDDDLDLDLAIDNADADDERATVVADLDDDDLDLDLNFDEDTTEIGDQATVIADLDDEELDFGAEPDAVDEAATVIADLDDDDFDLSIDEPSGHMETTITDLDLDQDDLELDVSMGPPETAVEDDSATVIADLDDQDLSLLDDDFSLEPDDETATPVTDAGDQEASIDDLDLSLDLEGDEIAAADAAPADELSLDFELEPETGVPDASADADAADELDFTLDMDDADLEAAPAADQGPELEDDLDMSSLEGLLDDDDEADDAGKPEEASDLTLSLDDDTASGVAETAALEASLDGLELDLDDGDTLGPDDDKAEGDQEIDLSEIEKMLEEPDEDATKFAAVPEQDLDLDVEASLETEKWMSETTGDDGQLVKDEELDLSELEQVLEDVDTDAAEDTSDDQELELDLDSGETPGAPTETVAVDSDLEFDLSAFEDEEVPDAGKASVTDRDAAEMELDFEVEDEQADQAMEDEGLEETVAIPDANEEKAEPETAAATPARPSRSASAPPKKGTSKTLVFLLIILLLGGGGYAAYYYMNQNGIEIPFLSQYMKPKVQDPGNLKLTTYDINSKFVDNAHVGKLFVISGKVKNGYTENRGIVTLLGKLFSTGKVAVNQERVYAGNVLSDLELANLTWDQIKTRLGNRLGDNRSNEKIAPGKSIPFMVVFSELPDNLEEFTIEVTGSTALK